MKLITTYQWVFVFLLISSFSKGQSEFFIKADSLLSAGLLEEASLQYDYVIYSQPGNADALTLAILKKTACLKQQKKFDRIGPLLKRIDINSLNDSLKIIFYFEKALGYYLSGNLELAEQNILPVFNLTTGNDAINRSSSQLYAFILNEQGRWKDASSTLQNYIYSMNNLSPEEKTSYINVLNDLYGEKRMPRLKSIKKARTLSLLFPGLGQAYNADYLKGLESLSFVSLAGIYIGYNIINATYFTTATAGLYSFLYFYFGGANQSNKLVPEKNYRKKFDYNNYLRANLINIHNELSNKAQ